jgi:hypothetical protein
MPNKSGAIGTATETAVVKVLLPHWPYAERRRLRGAEDWGDITGTPGIVWEVKGGTAAKTASDAQIEAWLDETETERLNAGADIGVLVIPRKGIGPANAFRWWAIFRGLEICDPNHPGVTGSPEWPVRMFLSDACRLLKDWGY